MVAVNAHMVTVKTSENNETPDLAERSGAVRYGTDDNITGGPPPSIFTHPLIRLFPTFRVPNESTVRLVSPQVGGIGGFRVTLPPKRGGSE